MKKLFLMAVLVIAGMGSANAQNFKVGINGGIPVSAASDYYTFSAGVNLSYTWNISENFELGVLTGYQNYFSEDEVTFDNGGNEQVFQPDDAGLVPIAANARYTFDNSFFVGGNLGYAIDVGDGEESYGGFLYEPHFGYSFGELDLYAYYQGIGSSTTTTEQRGDFTVSTTTQQIASLGIGLMYNF